MQENRFEAFAPVRESSYARWYRNKGLFYFYPRKQAKCEVEFVFRSRKSRSDIY